MSHESPDLASLVIAIDQLRQEVGQLTQRVAELEQSSSPAPPELTEELVMVLSAAVAAYLGEKPRIRQIRLVPSPNWNQEGRATIQASHALKF